MKKKNSDPAVPLPKPGPLFQLHWFRVILDEAQIIKNKCAALCALRVLSLTAIALAGTRELRTRRSSSRPIAAGC